MTTKAKTPPPWLSGFCNASNPPDSHKRCPATRDGRPCKCACHVPVIDVPGADRAPIEATPISETPAEATDPTDSLIGTPGFHDGIPEDQYHGDPLTLSQSGAKLILKAPALFRHQQLHPPVSKDHYDFGHAVHEKVLGVGAGIAVIPKTSKFKADQVAHREAKEKAHAEGKTPVTVEQYEDIKAMADVLSSHDTAMRLLSEGKPEVTAYCEDEATGVMRRARFDWLGATILSDYKSAISVEPWAFAGVIAKYGYHQQAAWYLDIARELGHPAEAFAFITQEKTAPYLVEVYDLDQQAIERGRELNARALALFKRCTETDQWPGYTGRDFTTLSLPRWAHYDDAAPIEEIA